MRPPVARAELGLALESAATGRAPGSPMHPVPVHHDAAETAIFKRVMGEYTEALHKDQSAVPVSMRLPMADMIADYGSDVHQILGKKMDGPTDFNQLEIDRGDLTRIIRATAEDPNAYKMIHGSQTVVISEGLDDFPADSFRKEDPELRAWVKQSASVLGHLDGVRGDGWHWNEGSRSRSWTRAPVSTRTTSSRSLSSGTGTAWATPTSRWDSN